MSDDILTKDKTRIICVPKNRVQQCIGYGFWAIITVGIMSLFIASTVEINSIYKAEPVSQYESDRYCYVGVFDGIEYCMHVYAYEDRKGLPHLTHMLSTIAVTINTIVIGFWVYHKQKKFKFSWCENIK